MKLLECTLAEWRLNDVGILAGGVFQLYSEKEKAGVDFVAASGMHSSVNKRRSFHHQTEARLHVAQKEPSLFASARLKQEVAE